MWCFLGLAAPLLVLALAGLREVVQPEVGLAGLTGFFACLLIALYFGVRLRRVALEAKTRSGESAMLIMMAGMLKGEDDATLEQIASRGGPAGQAALLLLEKRRTPQVQ